MTDYVLSAFRINFLKVVQEVGVYFARAESFHPWRFDGNRRSHFSLSSKRPLKKFRFNPRREKTATINAKWLASKATLPHPRKSGRLCIQAASW